MDDSPEQEQMGTQQPPVAALSPPATTSLGDRVREVRKHLERARAALTELDQLLSAGNPPDSRSKQ